MNYGYLPPLKILLKDRCSNTWKEIYQAGIATVGTVDTTITTGLGEQQSEIPGFTVFPNPTLNHLNILFDNKLTNRAEVLIYSNLGELVLREQI